MVSKSKLSDMQRNHRVLYMIKVRNRGSSTNSDHATDFYKDVANDSD